ncbi:MAG: PAS domain S-box protein [Chloroflexi bacterium]|nr:PAS domain S-box protein [Chloroflexota bacterium]
MKFGGSAGENDMDDQLRENELGAALRTISFFEMLLRASADGIVITDTMQRIIVDNEAFCAFFDRVRVVETNLLAWIEQFDKSTVGRWMELERRVHSEGVCRDVEFQLAIGAVVRTVSVTASLMERIAGVEGGAIIGIWHDITHRKNAEQALKASEKRYRSFIEVTGELGWTTNASGEVVEDIPSFRKFTGQSYEEIKGWGWSKALHPDDTENAIRVWNKAVLEKNKYEVEYRLRRYDGVYRHFLVRGVPTFKEDGSVLEWVGTCIDITERKLTEDAMTRLNSELNRKTLELEAVIKSLRRSATPFLTTCGRR